MGNLSYVDGVRAADQSWRDLSSRTSTTEAAVVIDAPASTAVAISARDVSFYYGQVQALKRVSLDMEANKVTTLIGPSGCGKSTFLRSINRMNDRISGARLEGTIIVDGQDVYAKRVNLMQLRRKVGMVFQKPNPFPASIFENIAMAPRLHYGAKGETLQDIVEQALRKAALWEEVKDSLKKSAMALSGGQQQRLCIARTLAVQPEIILMDEPCSALDPISTYRIEELIRELSKEYTLAIVTHNMHQAARISDTTAFFMMGELIESGPTDLIFSNPTKPETEAYISGRFG